MIEQLDPNPLSTPAQPTFSDLEPTWLVWAMLDRVSDITEQVATLAAEFTTLSHRLRTEFRVPDEEVLRHIHKGTEHFLARGEPDAQATETAASA